MEKCGKITDLQLIYFNKLLKHSDRVFGFKSCSRMLSSMFGTMLTLFRALSLGASDGGGELSCLCDAINCAPLRSARDRLQYTAQRNGAPLDATEIV